MNWDVLRFTVPGEPLGKGRPRVTKNGTYTPKATRDAEARVRAALDAAYPTPLLVVEDEALSIALTVYRYERRTRDVDNLLKLVMDALNGLAYVDDAQVEKVDGVHTVWVSERAQARTIVSLTRLGRQARPPRTSDPLRT